MIDRLKIVPITMELQKLVERNPDFEMSLASVTDRCNIIEHQFEQDLDTLNPESPYLDFQIEKIDNDNNARLAAVDKIMDRDEGNYYKRVSASWRGTAEEDVYQRLRTGRVRYFQECSDFKSVQYLLTEKEKKVTVKSTKFVRSHILTKVKVSITNFANDVNDTFDPAKNLMMAKDMKAMDLRKIIPSIILTDTDSVFGNL